MKISLIKEKMKHLAEFIKRTGKPIPINQQNTNDIKGYYYDSSNNVQIALWECNSEKESKKHKHEFNEYMVCLEGEYLAIVDNIEYVLHKGDDLEIKSGQEQWGKCIAGTITLHIFEGKRIVEI